MYFGAENLDWQAAVDSLEEAFTAADMPSEGRMMRDALNNREASEQEVYLLLARLGSRLVERRERKPE